jgi:hypothetical protein
MISQLHKSEVSNSRIKFQVYGLEDCDLQCYDLH